MKKFIVIVQAVILAMSLSTVIAVASDDEVAVGTPIYTADDFNKLYGSSDSFYLANDIDMGSSKVYVYDFSGTLDGNGYTIRNLSQPSLLSSVSNATIKNMTFTDVKITSENMWCAPLVSNAEGSTFEDISISGTITLKNESDSEMSIAGIAGYAGNCSFTNCITDIEMTASSKGGIEIYGIAKCWSGTSGKACKLKKCYAHGNISANMKNSENTAGVRIAGLCGGAIASADIVSCGNTGDINLICDGKAYIWIDVSGLSENSNSISKCYNTGNITVSGSLNTTGLYVAGLSYGTTENIKESYNIGNITVSSKCKCTPEIAGISIFGAEKEIINCYNTGKIKFTGKASGESYAGGILVYPGYTGKIKNCYSTGSITSKSKNVVTFALALYSNNSLTGNYYIKGKPFESGSYTAKNAKKVSKITAKNCPKLSSKYWVYSKAKGRMILKNNKEK